MSFRVRYWIGFVFLICVAVSSRAQEVPRPLDLSSLSDFEIDRRLDFITRRLDDDQLAGQLYQYGWTAFHLSSTIYSAVDYANSNDRKTRRTRVVEGIESAGSLGWALISPHPARLGADPVRTMPDETHQDRVRRLAAAESLLVEDADAANDRYSAIPHLFNVGTNIMAGAIIWAIADKHHALMSAVPGLFIGEAEIWTAPTHASHDLVDYNARFNGTAVSQANWLLVPTMGGVELRVRF